MTNEQILEKAIRKAVKNGFEAEMPDMFMTWTEWITKEEDPLRTLMTSKSIESLIFSHDFAKAFWGEEEYTYKDDIEVPCKYDIDDGYYSAYFEGPKWQYHLQKMIVESDPIKYLEQFI